MVVISATTKSDHVNIMIFGHDQKPLKKLDRETQSKFSFTTYYGGDYKICANNAGQYSEVIHIKLTTGIDAKDYSQMAQKSDIK